MSLLAGIVFLLCLIAIVAIFLILSNLWENLDLFPCPECESIDIVHPEGVDGAFNRCLECGKEWRDDEPI